MKNLEIYIDGTRLNFINREGFPLALNYSIESAENPSQVNGAHSKRTANFPGDGDTDRFFEEWANTTRINPDAATQKPARVDVNGITVLSGVAQLDEAAAAGIRHGRAGAEHKVGLFGNNATWFADMEDRLIRGLGLLPVHDLTTSFVSAHDNPDPDADAYGYFLARVKDWEINFNVRYTEMQPFLFIKAILKESFRLLGYSFNSDFFDGHIGGRLILPVPFREYSEDDIQSWSLYVLDEVSGVEITPGSIGGAATTHITVDGDNINDNLGGNYDYGTGFYTAPMSGYYIMAVPGPLPTLIEFHVRINGSTIVPSFTDPFFGAYGIQGRVFLEQGDTVELVAVTINTDPPPIEVAFLYIVPDFSGFEEGTTIDFSKYGNQEWAVSGLILGLTHAFGLVWDTDYDAQSVTVEPRDRYYNESQELAKEFKEGFYRISDRSDLTHRIDLSKDATVKALSDQKERVVFAWQSDGNDPNIGSIESDTILKYHDGKYTFPPGRFQKGEDRLENPFFSKTVYVLENNVKHADSPTVPQLPLFQSSEFGEEQSGSGDFSPRLLWFAGRRGGTDGLVNIEDFGSYDFPAAFMFNYNDLEGTDPNLSFCTETTRTGIDVPGLVQRFHLQRLKRIESGKMLVEWMRWSELEILNLDFRTKILIGDALYLLQKINGYRPLGNGSTETELLHDAIPAPGDLDKISGSSLIGYFVQNLEPE